MNEIKCSEVYSTAKNIIKVCIKDTKQNFIYIGHYLKEIRDSKLYQEDGYADFDTFMSGEIGKDKGWASRCINVASQFGIVENGQPALAEQYQDYSLSLLIEMVPMTPEQRELVTPDTEVKQAREIKKADKGKSCESQLPEPESEEQEPFQRGCITGKSRYGICSCCGGDGIQCCGQCKESCNSRCGWFDSPWEGEPEPPVPEPGQVAAEQEQPGEQESEQETVIDAEFTEVPPLEEYTPEYFLAEQQRSLDEILKAFKDDPGNIPRKLFERQKTIVTALTAMVGSQDQEEQDPVVQPELPILKNNDQRAAFVDAYETWPLWIETKETGERYYRYDLPDGTSMVVKVYHARLFDYKATEKTYGDRFREGYGRHEYYLLKEGKFFRDCETNRSLLIEKLKEIQKKGKG